MKSITYVQQALDDLDAQMQTILQNSTLNLTQKDHGMLLLLQQKRILQQTLEDLTYLRDNPPSPQQPCGISRYRES